MISSFITDSNFYSLQDAIEKKVAEIASAADKLPGVIIIHDIRTWGVLYLSSIGLKNLGLTLEEVQEMGAEYHTKFFHPEDAGYYVPKLMSLLKRNNNDEIISFFQQVRASENHDWEWHLSTVRILMRDFQNNPLLTITMACPIDPLHHITPKVSRLLEENLFLRKNFENFSKLTKREREILKFTSLGLSSVEIAEKLFLSVATVETHRKKVKLKLNAHSIYELSQYARAFDLI